MKSKTRPTQKMFTLSDWVWFGFVVGCWVILWVHSCTVN